MAMKRMFAMKFRATLRVWALAGAATWAGGPVLAQDGGLGAGMDPAGGKALKAQPAARSTQASQAMLLAAAWAGPRAVMVGEHGVVLLSDDQGAHVRQAQSVPVSSTLTGVHFTDAHQGWAVGHWGAILHTEDGGEHWQLQRLASQEDRPLFAVHFLDAQHGVAVGLWSLVLTTADGGKTWAEQKLTPPPGQAKADANLLGLFADAKGTLYAAAEHGWVLSSADQGQTWRYGATGYAGSFWAGVALPDGGLIVGGQRGNVYRSADQGAHWARIDLGGSHGSVTGFAVRGQEVLVVGLDGLQAQSSDAGMHFTLQPRTDHASLTAALGAPSAQAGRPWLLASRHGLAPTQAAAP